MQALVEQEEALGRLERRLDAIEKKLDEVIKELKIRKLRDIHLRILDMLDGWVSTADLAKVLRYRQEYISRKMAELKTMELVEEMRDKRSIKYRRKTSPK